MKPNYRVPDDAFDLADAPMPAFDLLDLMRNSGCAQVLIGLECPTEESLKGIELRADWKGI